MAAQDVVRGKQFEQVSEGLVPALAVDREIAHQTREQCSFSHGLWVRRRSA
jgi:hypothetical protein